MNQPQYSTTERSPFLPSSTEDCEDEPMNSVMAMDFWEEECGRPFGSFRRNRVRRNFHDFFKDEILNPPTDFSSVVWHPSAGVDFSPVVAYSKGYLGSKDALADLTPATLHIMTCIGGYEQELMNRLESKEGLLFEDELTRMHIAEYQMLELENEHLWKNPSPRNFHLGGRKKIFREANSDGFMAQVEVVCKKTGYIEKVPVLYLLGENIATYREFVGSGLFQVRHIKAVCEGLAFGGCSRSLIDFICSTEMGLPSLESIWLRRDYADHRFKTLSDDWEIEVGKMPLAFGGEVVRVSRKEVSHV